MVRCVGVFSTFDFFQIWRCAPTPMVLFSKFMPWGPVQLELFWELSDFNGRDRSRVNETSIGFVIRLWYFVFRKQITVRMYLSIKIFLFRMVILQLGHGFIFAESPRPARNDAVSRADQAGPPGKMPRTEDGVTAPRVNLGLDKVPFGAIFDPVHQIAQLTHKTNAEDRPDKNDRRKSDESKLGHQMNDQRQLEGHGQGCEPVLVFRLPEEHHSPGVCAHESPHLWPEKGTSWWKEIPHEKRHEKLHHEWMIKKVLKIWRKNHKKHIPIHGRCKKDFLNERSTAHDGPWWTMMNHDGWLDGPWWTTWSLKVFAEHKPSWMRRRLWRSPLRSKVCRWCRVWCNGRGVEETERWATVSMTKERLWCECGIFAPQRLLKNQSRIPTLKCPIQIEFLDKKSQTTIQRVCDIFVPDRRLHLFPLPEG